MKIALYGATGTVGQRILTEALSRGHDVTAIVRDPLRLAVSDAKLTVKTGDALDSASVATMVVGQDAVIGSISGRRDGDAQLITDAAQSLIDGVQNASGPRLLWVGGAGSLEVAPGTRLMDTPGFPDAAKAEAKAGADSLAIFRAAPEGLNWTYLSPAAIFTPGERTGSYRVGTDQLLVDSEGNSRISTEDYAVAMLDEIEKPQHIRQRFSVAY